MADLDKLYAALKAADASGNTTDAQALAGAIKAASGTPAGSAASPQPSFIDRVVASPVGRAVHDIGVNTVSGMAQMGARGLDIFAPGMGLGLMAPLTQQATQIADQPYQGSLDRNRNTPGYAAARAEADKVQQRRGGSGFTDAMVAPLLPTIAGTTGLAGGLDMSNAMADAQTQGQGQYAAEHPLLATGAGILGGLMISPWGVADAVPAYAGDNPILTRMGKGPNLMGPLPQKPPSSVSDPATSYVQRLMGSKTPADLINFDTGGKPITSAEAIGKPGTVGLGALARREGATPDALQGLLDERSAGAPGRVMEDYAAASGIDPKAAAGDMEGYVAAGRVKAAPLYDKAYDAAPAITDRLNQFAQEPIVQQGMKTGVKIARLKALEEGKPFDPNAYAITSFDEAGDPIIGGVPTWRTWDAAKLGLDNMLDQYRDKTTGRVVLDKMGDAINGVRRSMLKEIDGVNPAYKEARAQAGDYLSASEAFKRGQDTILNPNVTVAQFQKSVEGLTPADRMAKSGGVANKLFNLAQNGKLDPKLFNRPIVQQKLSVLLGPDKAAMLLKNVKSEADMAANAARMRPGNLSPTQELNAAMEEQDQGNSAVNLGIDAGANVMKHGLVRGAVETALPYLKNPIQNIRAGTMPIPVRDAAGSMLQLPPQELGLKLQNLPTLPRGNGIPKRIPLGALLLPQQSASQR